MNDIAVTIRELIRADSAGSARTAQSDEHLIGPSEIGGCRAYLAHMVSRTPRDPEPGIKLAAFAGSAIGDRIEAEWVTADPDTRHQVPITTVYPSGLSVSGSADIVTPTTVVDLKTKNGLNLVRRTGPTFAHRAQLQTYLLGLIQSGTLPPGSTGVLAYIDRSGADEDPAVFEYHLDMDTIEEIDSRLEDVMYAAMHDLDGAPRDMPYDFCSNYCPFFTHCRGKDEHLAAGLITSEEHLSAVKAYREALAQESQAKKIKDEAKAVLAGISGRAGDLEVTWSHVNETLIETYMRPGYDRMSIRAPRKPRKATATKE